MFIFTHGVVLNHAGLQKYKRHITCHIRYSTARTTGAVQGDEWRIRRMVDQLEPGRKPGG